MSKPMTKVLWLNPLENSYRPFEPWTGAIPIIYERLANSEIDDRIWHGVFNEVYETISSNPVYDHRKRYGSKS
jgi:hypothetical protein